MIKRALVILLATLTVACSNTSSASPSSSLPPLTPWQEELYNLQPDGTRTLDSALKMMAMAFGPIPGVDAKAQPAGDVGSATPAVRVVQPNLAQLTAEQQAAVTKYLTPPADTQSYPLDPSPSPSGNRLHGLPLAYANLLAVYDDPFIADVMNIGNLGSARAAEYFGTIPPFEGKPAVNVRFGTWDDGPFVSFHNPVWSPTGYRCDVLVNMYNAKKDRHLTYVSVVLDVVACYQSWVLGTEQGFMHQVPAWAWEGPEYYVAASVLPIDQRDIDIWQRYIQKPEVSLFSRSYDAVGYYEQIAYARLDLSAAMKAVLTDVDNPERFALAGTTANEFLDQWAPGADMNFNWPTGWQFIGSSMSPSIAQIKGVPQPLSVSNGSLEAFSQDAYSNHLFGVHSTADIVVVEAFGRVRVSDGTTDVIVRDSAAFCTTDKGCQPCPDGSPPEIEVSRLAPDSVLAVGGGTDGTNGTVSGHSLDEFCKKTPKPTPPRTAPPSPSGECSDGCASTAGDPHIRTVDNVAYDFQAAGEFVLLRSDDGSFELQGRQEPYPGTKNVSLSTAVAMRIAGRRLTVAPDPKGLGLLAKLDGQDLDPATTTDLGNGARIIPDGATATSFEVDFGDGTVLHLIGGGGWGVNVFLDPSPALRQSGRGVLGPVPPGGAAIPALPDGSTIPSTSDDHAYYQALYVQFADAWRVPNGASLFDYASGTSTGTYTIHGYPKEEDLVPVDDLTDAQRAAGEAACASVTDPDLHRHCVYDVGITSNGGFGKLYEATVQVLSGTSSVPSSSQQYRVVNLYSGSAGPTDVDVYSWTDAGPALLATVGFGTASAWFDPGSTNVGGQLQTKLSFQAHGQPVEQWGGSLYDPTSLVAAGVHKTIAFATGNPANANSPGGKQGVSYVELYEEVPAEFGAQRPRAGSS